MHKKLKKAAALMLCFAMLLSSGAASVFSEDEAAEEDTSASEEASEEEDDDSGSKKEKKPPRTEDEAKALLKPVAENDKMRLWKNEKEKTIALEDLNTGKFWWSNPIDIDASGAKGGQKSELQSGMTMIYAKPEERSTKVLNKASAKMKDIPNGVEFTYTFSESKTTVPVQITLEDDHLKLHVNTADIIEENPDPNRGLLSTDFAFMTSFGAANLNDTGYFVIPDGCGAVINFNNGKSGLKSYTGKVYGRDLTQVKKIKQPVTKNINMPVYGIVKGNSGLMVVADKGDTCASINCYIAGHNAPEYNSAYFDFEVRTKDEYLIGGDSNPLTVFEKKGILVPEIELRYYPISRSDKSDVDYTDIAAGYRNYLIKDRAVEDKDLTDNTSLFLDLYGATLKKESVAGIPVTVKEPVTKFATAKYMLQTLKNMGVDDMVVAYNSYNDDNIAEKVADSFNPSSKLGGSGKFKDLNNYAKANNIKLFPVVDNQQFKTGNGYWNVTNTAMRVSNAYAQVAVYEPAHGVENEYYKPLALFTPNSYRKAFGSLIKSYNKKGITNYSFGTLCNTVYGDYGRKSMSREQVKGVVTEIYGDVKSKGGQVLSAYPAVYTLPYTDYITDVPTCSSKYDIFDYEVPFYQMVLHGVTPYATTAINGEADLGQSVLKALAAGSNIGFDFVGIEASELKDTKLDSYYYAYYANWVNEASGLYKLSDEILSPASDASITGYNITEEGNKIETTYDNGYKTVADLEKLEITANGKTYKLTDYVGEGVISG